MISSNTAAKVSFPLVCLLYTSILGAIITEFLYNRFPKQDEGFLTKTRSKLVNRTFLTRLAFHMKLDMYIRSNTTKNIDSSHIYGDAVEALIGAIYLDVYKRQVLDV